MLKEYTKRVKFQIFNYMLTIIVTNNVFETLKKNGWEEGQANALAIHLTNKLGCSYIIVPLDTTHDVIAHESSHCVWACLEFMGAKPDSEIFAHTLEFVVREVTKLHLKALRSENPSLFKKLDTLAKM